MYWKGCAEKEETAALGVALVPIANPPTGATGVVLALADPNPNPADGAVDGVAAGAGDPKNPVDPGVPVAAGLAPKVNICVLSDPLFFIHFINRGKKNLSFRSSFGVSICVSVGVSVVELDDGGGGWEDSGGFAFDGLPEPD